ncbi:malate dehydrogenase [Candidatus Woesearchaeota archaeon]|nr:malate dehydrogenase [Candidatus Woesearchaeota archaeon]
MTRHCFCPMTKISFIGAGNVGTTAALRVIEKQLGDVVLLDIDSEMALGKSLDLSDYQSSVNGKCKIIGTSDYSLIKDSDIIVVTAGRARKKEEKITREGLAQINTDIIKTVAENIKKYSPDSIVLTVTNPVDKMNKIIFDILQTDRKKIIGVGSLLDSFRLKTVISEELKTPSSAVLGMVIGPHNDDMIPLFSKTTVNGKKITELITADRLTELKKEIQLRGKKITSLMGSGYYAIGNTISLMIETILQDKKEIIPASIILEGEYGITDISVGVPIKLGRNGAEVVEMDFSEKEELVEIAGNMLN